MNKYMLLILLAISCNSSQIKLLSLNKIQKQQSFDNIKTCILISSCLSKNVGIFYLNITKK
jgi:hypothetical protein